MRARLDALLDDPSVVAVGECGLDYFRERALARARRPRPSRARSCSPRSTGKPLVIHTREAAEDTLAVLRGTPAPPSILHCFSLPEHLDEVVERGWYVSFAGNVTYPSASELADAARRVPAELLLLETDCPYLSPVPHRGKPNRPHCVLETLRAVAAMRGVDAGELGEQVEANAARVFAFAMNAPRQVTLARLAELGLRPDRELGQHFLVDDNVLGVIERLADLAPGDVALEIGAGVGTLTARLAERCAHVHAVEIDRRLEQALTRTLDGHANVTVHWGDAMRLDLGGFEPAATAFVANLPYHVAAPLVLDSIGGLPGMSRWCVLVQREIAERLTAGPGDALYGGPSVLCALALAPAGRHAVSRSVFVPVPNVDSTLVAFTRRPEWPELAADWPQVVATVRAAFAYRRKTLGNALTLAGWREDRAAVEAACRAAGVDPGARAEALPPETFLALARAAA